MKYYYAALQSKAHAFLIESKFKATGIQCEIMHLPRPIKAGLCNVGVRFSADQLGQAVNILKTSGLPGYKVYSEIVHANGCAYYETDF